MEGAGIRKEKKKRSTKRQTVQISGWGRPQLKADMKWVADSEGISLSQAVVAACEELVRMKRHQRREVLEKPILEAFFDKKLGFVVNQLSDYLSRLLVELEQLRWLYVNRLYHSVLNPDKKLTKEAFYTLLDRSQKEAVKAAKAWNPDMQSVAESLRKYLQEGEQT
jgi:hypothetical protein